MLTNHLMVIPYFVQVDNHSYVHLSCCHFRLRLWSHFSHTSCRDGPVFFIFEPSLPLTVHVGMALHAHTPAHTSAHTFLTLHVGMAFHAHTSAHTFLTLHVGMAFHAHTFAHISAHTCLTLHIGRIFHVHTFAHTFFRTQAHTLTHEISISLIPQLARQRSSQA